MSAPTPVTPWPKAIVIGIIGSAIVSLIVLAFLWPSMTSEPKDISVDVVASEQAYSEFTERAGQAAQAQGSGLPFEFHRVDSREAAVDSIKTREAYGAYVLPDAPGATIEVLTAKAANPQVATMLTSTADAMVGAQASQVPTEAPVEQRIAALEAASAGAQVTDIVPLSENDPNGTGFALAALPLTIGGIIGGVVTSLALTGTWRRLVGVITYAIVGSAALFGILDLWFDLTPGPAYLVWPAIALSLAATASVIVGLHSLLGAPGIGVGAILTMFIGNPLAGSQAPKEFLPDPFGEIGQLFVPGATGTLLRDVSYFPDASTLAPWLTLAVWTAAGLLLITFAHHRSSRFEEALHSAEAAA